MKNPGLTCLIRLQAVALLIGVPGPVLAESCCAPPRPFLPSDSQAAQDYVDIIRRDFEGYIQDIQSDFRCLDGDRADALGKAREVSEDYGQFLQLVRD